MVGICRLVKVQSFIISFLFSKELFKENFGNFEDHRLYMTYIKKVVAVAV